MRILHLSDIHVWRYSWNPRHLLGRRLFRTIELLGGRANLFDLLRLDEVIARAADLRPDHVLITGDLTTMAMSSEFREARRRLAPLLGDPSRATVLPGNHDRTTGYSAYSRRFERFFGAFQPAPDFPWLRWLDDDTAILGLDPTRPRVTAKGKIPDRQLAAARQLLENPATRPRRPIIACHYPAAAPSPLDIELARKRMVNQAAVRRWLGGIGPHLYCCGHVHAAWAFHPESIPGELCLNSGAPLQKDPSGLRPPGFLEIVLDDRCVSVTHHAWEHGGWSARPLVIDPAFFPPSPAVDTRRA
ncbi:MAG: metallophosphoesterase [Isosphaeraceae bacterium]